MQKPRDHFVTDRVGWVHFARLFSNIVSPPIMFAVMGFALAWWELSFWSGFLWAMLYGVLVSLMPILFIVYMLHTGRITELHMTNQRERYWPYLVALVCAFLFWFIVRQFDGPELLQCLAIFNIIELISLALINLAWLISIHATGIVGTTLLAGYVFGPWTGLALFPLILGVIWARVFLKRHTPAQLVGGACLGIVTVLTLVLLGCF